MAIATWNRAELLAGALESLVRASMPGDIDVEFMVVDNGSSDRTPDLLREWAESHGVVALREDRPGKSHALNLATVKSTGEFIIWIDDDIRVAEDWLVRYAEAFAAHPRAAVFGGSITPTFQGHPPAWIVEGLTEVGGIYGLCQPAQGPIALTDPFLPFGGNMAVRTSVQRQHPYDPSLGRRHGQLLAGEESAVVRNILLSGEEGRWVPAARVSHVVPPRMQSLAYVRRYYHDYGVSLSTPEDGARPRLPPLWALRDAVERELRYRIGRALRRPAAAWLRNLRLASFAQGTIRGRPMRSV